MARREADDVISTTAVNAFLRNGGESLSIRSNPCVSPDFCLRFDDLFDIVNKTLENVEANEASIAKALDSSPLLFFPSSRLPLRSGDCYLVEEPTSGDHAWLLLLHGGGGGFESEAAAFEKARSVCLFDGGRCFPSSYANLLRMKVAAFALDPKTCAFPSAVEGNSLEKTSLGVGVFSSSLSTSLPSFSYFPIFYLILVRFLLLYSLL